MRVPRLIVISAFLAATGCAGVDDITKLDLNSYRTFAASSPAQGGSTKARSLAMDKANIFCAGQGTEITAKSTKTTTRNILGVGITEITFHCVAAVAYVASRPSSAAATGAAPAAAQPPK